MNKTKYNVKMLKFLLLNAGTESLLTFHQRQDCKLTCSFIIFWMN